jgi:ATP-dependent DNA helicase RecG
MSEIDLRELARRESEQTEWKENVADVDDVVRTLSAFANDLANLGGGYVVCGACEAQDEHGFQTLVRTGLEAARFKEIEGRVLTACRQHVSPAIAPRVAEYPSDQEGRRILVFIQPATPDAHSFRSQKDGTKHFVRIGRATVEARNGVFRNLLVRKGAMEPWDRRPCQGATERDLDFLLIRDVFNRLALSSPVGDIDPYIFEERPLNALVPSLCVREPLTRTLRPRNFAMLLFGRDMQRFAPGAYSIFSIYRGLDRAASYAERHEVLGTLVEQASRLKELLDAQSYTAYDKENATTPNAVRYPKRALYEALGNALAHRDYEMTDPTRITVFDDRIEILSPGPLPLGVDDGDFREGRAPPTWRNQTLAWFFPRLQLAQGEGQGIPTILRSMRDEGCPPPSFQTGSRHVVCLLPAHPRHVFLRAFDEALQATSSGEYARAESLLSAALSRYPLSSSGWMLLADLQDRTGDIKRLYDFVIKYEDSLTGMPSFVKRRLSESLAKNGGGTEENRTLARRLGDNNKA